MCQSQKTDIELLILTEMTGLIERPINHLGEFNLVLQRL